LVAKHEGKEAARLLLRLYRHSGILVADSKKAAKPALSALRALVAYGVGFARRQHAKTVVMANLPSEKLADALSGGLGHVTRYFEFADAGHPERYQIEW
ncbi:MAG: hypothetical protein Q8P02_01430, partial [Candidatus Micrarchaeota archaeon]|nr:hypothetical protein [Candidatus Micrarchaeota archaeon]